PGADPDRPVLRRRTDRRLPVLGVPATGLAGQSAPGATGQPAPRRRVSGAAPRTPAGTHRQLAVAGRATGVLRRRSLAADAAERPAPMAGPGAAVAGRGQTHRRADRPAAHQPVLPG